jgi:CrcB protein
MSFIKFLIVFVGGGLGSSLRYLLAQVLITRSLWGVPLSTLTANLLASFILGIVWVSDMRDKQSETFVFMASGFCGGLSTFSTFAQENVLIWERLGWLPMLINILFNVILCTLTAFLITRYVGAA